MNNVNIIGRLTRYPELKNTNSGMSVASFSIAVNEGRGDDAKAHFFNCTAFKQTAEFLVNYGAKGKRVAVSGRLQQRRWTDDHGNERSVVEIVANNLSLLDWDDQGEAKPKSQTTTAQEDDFDPFADE